MYYARWCKSKEMKQTLKEINIQKEVSFSGTPITYEGNNPYIVSLDAHSLIIGATGSGKTQATILPVTKLALLAGESVVINDINGEIYQQVATNFKDNGYNVIVLDFDKPNLGSAWNPLLLPYEFYQNKESDKAISLIEDLGYYLFTDPQNKEM